MKKSIECSQKPIMKTCSLCNKSSEAEGMALIYFGEWMEKKEVVVHYYCLLLSTHLPQRGEDHSGILGFLMRDIRQEIVMASKRKCKYCLEMNATIQCCTCKKYFHLTCGHTSKCLSQFVGEFKSYCHLCLPADQYQKELLERKRPLTTELCFICRQKMFTSPEGWIYAKCCGSGFTHSKCMKIYALSAGYYLTCIWCKDKRFREDIKYLGIFVPDREANWEKEKGAYGELYRSHKRCDMEICHCPKGRDYISAFKWQLITCKFCGAFGAHNPSCISGIEGSKEKIQEFKCDVCSVTQQTVHHKTITSVAHDLLDTSLYVNKQTTEIGPIATLSQTLSTNNSQNNDSISSGMLNTSKSVTDAGSFQIASGIYTLTQSQQLDVAEYGVVEMVQEQSLECDDSTIADLLVQKMLNIFEAN